MKNIFTLFILLSFISLKAQNTSCGFDEKLKRLISADPSLKNIIDANNIRLQEIMEKQSLDRSLPPVYEIPVVVHVFYRQEGAITVGNISTAQIQSAINNLNDAFAGMLGPSPNVEIEFCLASQSPDCSSTNGIVRMDMTNFTAGGDNYSSVGITDNNEVALKSQSIWPSNQYYNVWSVVEIDDNNGGIGTQGYAYLPGLGAIERDGTVLLYNTLGYDPSGSIGYDLKPFTRRNNTLIHETGHFLNLYHTFYDGGDETTCATGDCATTGDFICDTEPHLNPNSVCEENMTNSCTGALYGDVVYNYMNYSPETCTDRFSSDQVARMRATMLDNLYLIPPNFVSTGRRSLNSSEGCSNVLALTSTTGYPSDETDGDKLDFNIGTTSIQIGNLFIENASPVYDQSYSGSTHVEHCDMTIHGQGNTVNVNLDVEAFDELEDNFIHAKVYIDYNNDGDFLDLDPAEEALLLNGNNTDGGLLSGQFTLPVFTNNRFNDLILNQPLKMRIVSDFTGFTTGQDISSATVAYGQMEDMNIMITGVVPVELLSFDAKKKENTSLLSWTTNSEINNDYFLIERSSDGINYQNLGKVKSTSDVSDIIEYSFIDRQPFNNLNYYRLSQFDLNGDSKILGVRVVEHRSENIDIYPNPISNGNLVVVLSKENQQKGIYKIHDISGRLVSKGSFEKYIDVEQLESGMYFLTIEVGTAIYTKDFVKTSQ